MRLQVRIDPPAPGAANMERDLELAAAAVAGGEARLRLYAWSPPAVSIGLHQSPEGACDPAACAALGWDGVRRPTGGRAVLHAADEVTYAVALPLGAAPEGVLAAYALLAEGLLQGYRRLGLPAQFALGRRLHERTGACFDAPAAHEIVCGGRKIAGSAQVRRAGYLLQHGSLPVRFDPALHARLLGLPPAAAAALGRRAAGIADFLSPPPPWRVVALAMAAGFRQALRPVPPNPRPASGAMADDGGGVPAGPGDPRNPRTQPQPAWPA